VRVVKNYSACLNRSIIQTKFCFSIEKFLDVTYQDTFAGLELIRNLTIGIKITKGNAKLFCLQPYLLRQIFIGANI